MVGRCQRELPVRLTRDSIMILHSQSTSTLPDFFSSARFQENLPMYLSAHHHRSILVIALLSAVGLLGMPSSLPAQVVQLPSMSSFGYSGAMNVPDRGQAYFGGVGSMQARSRVSSGLPLASRAMSQSVSGTSVSVSATVIDLQAMDAALLAQPVDQPRAIASRFRAADRGTPIANTLDTERYRQFVPHAPLPPEPNAWRQALGAPGDAPLPADGSANGTEADVRFYMQKAQDCYNSGRLAAARVYFDLAYQKLTPAQQALMLEHQTQEKAAASAGTAAASVPPAKAATDGSGKSGTTRPF